MLTQKQKDKIDEKKAAMPKALQRDNEANYKEGYFFITLNTREEVPAFGCVEGHIGGQKTDMPHMRYSELGEKVMANWESIPRYHPQVELIAAEVMPEHFHGLLYLSPDGTEHLGRIVNGFMIACTHAYWDILGIAWRDMKKDLTKGERAAAHEWQDNSHTHSYRGPAVFVRGYNDVIPITEKDVQTKIEYIHTQAEKRLIKGNNALCFDIHRGQRSCHWSKETALNAILKDTFFRNNAAACEEAKQKVTERLLDGLDWVGSKELLLCARKLPLVCHRADINLFEQQKEAVLAAAQDGAVIVSAFISSKEREIRDLLFAAQIPVIEIMDNGFSERYKPYGKAFYACAENKLVQISPWKYLYQRESKISREMCLVMNELSLTICQCGDDWWKNL